MFGREATVHKVLMDVVECAEMLSFRSTLHGSSEDCIAVIHITHQDVFVAMAGSDWEPAGEVGGNLMVRFGNGREYKVCLLVEEVRWWGKVFIRSGRAVWMRGTDVLTLLMLVALDGWDGFSEMLTNQVRGKAGPCGEMAAVDGFDPGGGHWISTCGMEKRDMVHLGAGVIGTVGLCCVRHEESVVSQSFILHTFVDHAVVGRLQWNGPKVGDGVPVANKNMLVVLGDRYPAGIESGNTALVAKLTDGK